ncbi:hypothetical protein [Candidatus Poriferisocius sp.]|uniref:hypothetical protein n=1 Tax=Candidatus Poriferisocius sp. TaxID=3101276 RepID=UPI003B019697
MASSTVRARSGSQQVLKVGLGATANVTIAEPGLESGFSGLTLEPTPNTFESKSGGLTTTHNAGGVVLTGSFDIDETERTLPVLLGGNGRRYKVEFTRATGVAAITFDAIFAISRTFEDRGKRTFSVTVTVDGDVT